MGHSDPGWVFKAFRPRGVLIAFRPRGYLRHSDSWRKGCRDEVCKYDLEYGKIKCARGAKTKAKEIEIEKSLHTKFCSYAYLRMKRYYDIYILRYTEII